MNYPKATIVPFFTKIMILVGFSFAMPLCYCCSQPQPIVEPIQVIGKYSLNISETISYMYDDLRARLQVFQQQCTTTNPSMLNTDAAQAMFLTANKFMEELSTQHATLFRYQKMLKQIPCELISKVKHALKRVHTDMRKLKQKEEQAASTHTTIPHTLVAERKRLLDKAIQCLETIKQEARYQTCFNFVHTITPEPINEAYKALLSIKELNKDAQAIPDYSVGELLKPSLSDALRCLEEIAHNTKTLADYRNGIAISPRLINELEQNFMAKYHEFCRWYAERILFLIQFRCRYKRDIDSLITQKIITQDPCKSCPCQNKDNHCEIIVLSVDIPIKKMVLLESNASEWNGEPVQSNGISDNAGTPINTEEHSVQHISVCPALIKHGSRLFMINSNNTVYIWLLPPLHDAGLELQIIGRTHMNKDPLLRIVTETAKNLTPLYVPLVGKIKLSSPQTTAE